MVSVVPFSSVSLTEVDVHTKAIVGALDVVLRPDVDERLRYRMLQVCQDFKEKYPLCLSCGLQMAHRSYPDTARHFGLQIVEHVTKFFWSHMSRNEKDYLKSRIQTLMIAGFKLILLEKSYIKDVTARIMVKLIKNDWPFTWPDLPMDLDRLAMQGDVQTEIVMLILLRLSEDLVTLEKGPAEMRAKIKSALELKMPEILTIILRLLDKYVVVYRKAMSDPTESYQAESSCKCAIATLKTLAEYLEWMDLRHITEDNCKLLHTVLLLLHLPALEIYAAECLHNAVVHAVKLKSGRSVLPLFEFPAMRYICNAAEIAPGEYLTESKNMALKKICELVCVLGFLLTDLMGTDPGTEVPPTFEKYLNCLFQFTTHSSQNLRFFTQSVWLALFTNPVLSKDPKLLSVLPKYLSATVENLQKEGFPSKNDDPSCQYARFDFAGDDDFREFFAVFHAEQREVLKVACRLDPKATFQMASDKLKNMLSTHVEPGLTQAIAVDGQVLTTSNYVSRSEALTYFTETVINELFQVLNKEDHQVEIGVQLLQLALNFKTTNPSLLFCSLTNVATLCPFLSHGAEFTSAVLRKFITIITMNKTSRQPELKNIRKYACATLSKICREHAPLLLNEFPILYGNVKPLVQLKTSQLTPKEKCFLIEAVVIASNQFKEYERQKAVLEEFLSSVTSFWLSEEIERVLEPKSFIQFIGANVEFTEQQVFTDTTMQNCSRISYCTSAILGLLACIRNPRELQEAKDGSFDNSCKPNGDQIYQNPCGELALKLLFRLLDLIRVLQNLFLPDMVLNFSHSFAKVLDVPEVEKPSVPELPHPLASISTPIRETRLERKQRFLINLYENCFHILGLAGESLKHDFYNIEDLASLLLTSAFANISNLPDHRITIMLQRFVKPLVLNCPTELYHTLLVPILGVFLNSLHERLTNKWFLIDQWNTMKKENNIADIPENSETLENHTQQLTREVMDLVCTCCLPNPEEDASVAESNYDEMVENETAPPPLASTELTELGICLMKYQDVRSALMILAFSSLTWKDNFTCYQSATKLCWSLFNKVITEQLIPSAVLFFYSMTLKGVEAQGEHAVNCEALVNLAFQFYATLRPRYSVLQNFMRQLPEIIIYHLDKFDVDICGRSFVKKSSIERKKSFIELLKGYIKVPLCKPCEGSTADSSIKSLDQPPSSTTTAVETSATDQMPKAPLFDSEISENVPSQTSEQKIISSSPNKQTPDPKNEGTLVSVEDEDVVVSDSSPPAKKSPATAQKTGLINDQFVSAAGVSMELTFNLPLSVNTVDHVSACEMSVNHSAVSQNIIASFPNKQTPDPKNEGTLVSVEDEDDDVSDTSPPAKKSPATAQKTGLINDQFVSAGGDSKELTFNLPLSVNTVDHASACEMSVNHSAVSQNILLQLEDESPWVTTEDNNASLFLDEEGEMACEPPEKDSRSRKWRFHSPPRDNVVNPLPRARKSRFDIPPPGLVSEQMFPSGKVGYLLCPQETVNIPTPPIKKLKLDSPPSVKTDNFTLTTVKPEKIFVQLKQVPLSSKDRTPEAEQEAPLVSMEGDSD